MRVESTWKPLLEAGAKPVFVGVTASGRLDGSVAIGRDGLNPERLSQRRSEVRRALHHLGIAGNPAKNLAGIPAETLQSYVAQIQNALQLAGTGEDQGMSQALASAREFAKGGRIRVHERRLEDIAAGGYRASYETSLQNLAKARYVEHVDRFLEGARRCATAGRLRIEPEELAAAETTGCRSAHQAALARANQHAGQTSLPEYYSNEIRKELAAARAIAKRGGFAPDEEAIRSVLGTRLATDDRELLKARAEILSPSGKHLFLSSFALPQYKERLQNITDLAKTEGGILFQGSNFDFARYCELEVDEILRLADTRISHPSDYKKGEDLKELLDLARFVAQKGGVSAEDSIREKARACVKSIVQAAAFEKKNFRYSSYELENATKNIGIIRQFATAYGIDAEKDLRAALKPVCADLLKEARKVAMNGYYGVTTIGNRLEKAQKIARLGGLDIGRHVQEIESLKSFWRRRLHFLSDLFDWSGNPNWPK